MSKLQRKLRRRHVASGAVPRDPSVFVGPAHVDHVRKVADRVAKILGRPAACDPHHELIFVHRDGDTAEFPQYVFGTTDRDTWHGDALADDGRVEATIDSGISTDPAVYVQLGVETHARGIAAAVKRYERERDNRPDRVIGSDSRGADVYESDLDGEDPDAAMPIDPALEAILANGRPVFPGEPGPGPDDEAFTAAEWARKYGEERRPVRDARGLLIHLGDALAAIGLEPDLGGDTITFTFLGRVHRLELEDLERRTPGRDSATEAAMMAAGLPVG